MTRDLRRYAVPAYAVGALALLAAGAWYIVNRRADLVVQVALALGVTGLAAGVSFDPGRVRRALAGRQARYGSNALLLTLAFLGVLIVLNVLAYNNPLRSDLTEDRQYTLAPETRLALSRLPGPVTIEGFYSADLNASQEQIRPLLEEYRRLSGGQLTFEFIDPQQNPARATERGVLRDGSLVVVFEGSAQVISFPREQDLTSALIQVTNPAARAVYFLTGHGEADSEDTGENGYSQARQALASKGYQVGVLNLLVDARIPEDALALIIAGPQAPLASEEVEVLREYLAGGGALVVMLQPNVEQRSSVGGPDPLLDELAAGWGIAANDDLVVEPNSRNYLVAVSFRYATHPVTERLQQMATLFPVARSLSLTVPESGEVTLTGLIYTSDFAWGEADPGFLSSQALPEFDSSVDLAGPLALAAAAEHRSGGGRLVVFGDADFGANAFYSQYGNGDLLVNSVDWAAGQEGLIDLTPRTQTQRFIVPPSTQVNGLIMLGTVVLMPGAVIAAGVVVWWQRRKNA